MAKDRSETTGEAPRATDPEKAALLALIDEMRAEVRDLKHRVQVQQEVLANSKAAIIDPDYQRWKEEAARPASERTQDVADRKYGTAAPRFRVRLDSTAEDGKKGPNISEHFALAISANSEDEAGARYLKIMGIRKHDYRLVVEPGPVAA